MNGKAGIFVKATFIGLMTGMMAVFLRPLPAGDAAASASLPQWHLPDIASLAWYHEPDFQRVRNAPVWGESAAKGGTGKRGERSRGGAAGGEVAPWRLAGVTTVPEPVALILRDKETEPLRSRPGEKTPDGDEIVRITDTGVYLKKPDNGCTFFLPLYRHSGDTGSDASCDAAKP